MSRRSVIALVVACAVASASRASSKPRVILMSWDGAGQVLTSRLLSEGKLPNLQRIVNEGAWTDGMVSSFPTKTAAAHAVLFTGYYGHRSGITGNGLLKFPKEDFSRLDTHSGYFANGLVVDPLWIRTARAGLSTYVFHGTQTYPFEAGLRDLSEAARQRLFLVHGYTDVQERGHVFGSADVELAPPVGWAIPEASGDEARAFAFSVGETPFWGLFFDDPFDPAGGWDTLGIARGPESTFFEARIRTVDTGFSPPVAAQSAGRDVWFSLRVLEASSTEHRFLLYRSGAVELALSNPDTPRRDSPALQVFAGNSGSSVYESGELGPTRAHGGDGTAERRLHDTLAHLQAQIIAQARVALDEDYSFLVLYSPVTDDVNHAVVGYLDPTLDGYDAVTARHLWETVAFGYELQDRFLGVILDAAERDGAHVVLVSDHGMTGTDRLIHLNVALEQAGLLSLNADRTIDLSRTRVLAPPLSDGSIAVNSVDRAGGIVPMAERESVLGEARRALLALKDPETGAPLVARVFDASTSGLLQPGGASTGDLFLDFAPRYYPSTSTDVDVVVTKTAPIGNHVFVPTRREMLAICAAWGPRVPSSINWGRVRAIDIAPTVLDLLELDPPSDLPGRSVVPPRPILTTR